MSNQVCTLDTLDSAERAATGTPTLWWTVQRDGQCDHLNQPGLQADTLSQADLEEKGLSQTARKGQPVPDRRIGCPSVRALHPVTLDPHPNRGLYSVSLGNRANVVASDGRAASSWSKG